MFRKLEGNHYDGNILFTCLINLQLVKLTCLGPDYAWGPKYSDRVLLINLLELCTFLVIAVRMSQKTKGQKVETLSSQK